MLHSSLILRHMTSLKFASWSWNRCSTSPSDVSHKNGPVRPHTPKRIVAPLTTFVDNGKYLATILWTVIEIEWNSALVDINVQLGARGLKRKEVHRHSPMPVESLRGRCSRYKHWGGRVSRFEVGGDRDVDDKAVPDVHKQPPPQGTKHASMNLFVPMSR